MERRHRLETFATRMLAALAFAPLASACGDDTDSTSAGAAECTDSTPVSSAVDTGIEVCEEGYTHRASAPVCTSTLPRAEACPEADQNLGPGCTSDADCTEQPHGHCSSAQAAGGNAGAEPAPGCYCRYGCTTDAECGEGSACICGIPVGYCVKADCRTDADCSNGLCASYITTPGCGSTAYACQTESDECGADVDCPNGQCTMEAGRRVCGEIRCAAGRPFLVDGEHRVAPVVASAAWQVPTDRALEAREAQVDRDGSAPRTSLDAETRARIGASWLQVAQMEHASIAAFARLSLELLALGAPPQLVAEASQAMADETAHALFAFTIASRHLGRDVGPGPLDLTGALTAPSAEEVAIRAVLEGCIGETVAAVEAAELAHGAVDPEIRAALVRITEDEARHAELAFRTVAWLAQTHGTAVVLAVTSVMAEQLAGARSTVPADAAPSATDRVLLENGILTDSMRTALRRDVLANVVAPCLAQLTASPRLPADGLVQGPQTLEA